MRGRVTIDGSVCDEIAGHGDPVDARIDATIDVTNDVTIDVRNDVTQGHLPGIRAGERRRTAPSTVEPGCRAPGPAALTMLASPTPGGN